MKLDSLNMIWAKTLTQKQTESGIILPKGQGWSSRLGGDFFEAEILVIGLAIPLEELQSADGKRKLEVGDRVIIQKWNNEIEWQRTIDFEGSKYLLISSHDIMGFEKKKK